MIEIVAMIDTTTTVEILALVRVVPYLVGAYIAYHKGYRYLAVGAGMAGALVLINYLFHIDTDLRNMLFNVVAWVLMVHALKLVSKKE